MPVPTVRVFSRVRSILPAAVLFPSWHRPCVLAIEQSINETAIQLARRWTQGKKFPEDTRKRWMDAASQLRFPFWDWTDLRGASQGLPDVLRPQIFRLRLPNQSETAQLSEVDNPLAFHAFENGPPRGSQNVARNDGTISYFSAWPRTYRRPSNSPTPFEDYVDINTRLRQGLPDLRNKVGNLFCYPVPSGIPERQRPTIWDEFSNTRSGRDDDSGWTPIGRGTIEQPHNQMHVLLGGRGAMSHPDYAGFDPIFYLHHCNIDRILAFWEHTYDKFWVGEGYYKKDGDETVFPFTQPGGSWGEEDDAKIGQNSSLAPYRNREGNYWTPLQARFVKDDSKYKHGYTYPEIVEVIEKKTRKVNLDDPRPAADKEVNACKAVLQQHFGLSLPQAGLVGLGDAENEPFPNYRRFYVSIQLVEHAFGGSYSLELVYEGKVVATFAVFARSETTRCAACRGRREEGGLVGSFLDIPDQVIEAVVKKHMDELSKLLPLERLGTIAIALMKDIRLQLVDVGGRLLAVNAVEHSAPASGEHGGEPLEDAIIPKVKLMAARAFKGMGLLPSDGAITGEIEFGEPAEFGDYLGGGKWRKAERSEAEGEVQF